VEKEVAMFEYMVLAVDGSAESRKAVPVAAEIAGRFQADLTVLHVREHENSWAADIDLEEPSEATDLVDGIVRELKDVGISARGEVRRAPTGLVSQEILLAAGDLHADLIVVGSRGLTDWQGLLLGSVAHKVIHHATCPVLVVR
jgi:nucleotide-binding universal stress UspA family protein